MAGEALMVLDDMQYFDAAGDLAGLLGRSIDLRFDPRDALLSLPTQGYAVLVFDPYPFQDMEDLFSLQAAMAGVRELVGSANARGVPVIVNSSLDRTGLESLGFRLGVEYGRYVSKRTPAALNCLLDALSAYGITRPSPN